MLEEEGLLKEAYIEEIKVSIDRFAKVLQASVNVAPLLKTYLETQQQYQNKQQRSYSFLAGIIFASALFLGSAIILPHQGIRRIYCICSNYFYNNFFKKKTQDLIYQ